MHVLLLIDTLIVGGAEYQVVTDANLLAAKGFQVTVAAFREGPLRSALTPGVEFICLRSSNWVGKILALQHLCHEKRVDLIQSHMWLANQIGALTGWLLHIPVISTEHGMELWRSAKHIWSAKLTYRLVNHVYAVCEATRQVKIQREGLAPARISVMYNCFSSVHVANGGSRNTKILQFFAIEQTAPVIGFVGRLHPVKRLDLLVDIAREVCSAIPSTIFLVVGDGPEKELVTKLTKKAGLEENFRLVGYQTRVADFFGVMNILMMTSQREALSMAILEAAASGVPTVGFSVGGNAEAIEHEKTGFVVPFGEVGLFSQRLIELLSHQELLLAMGQQAQSRAFELFSPQARLSSLVSAYKKALPDGVL